MDLIELPQDIVGAVRPFRWIFLQTLHDDRGECRWRVGTEFTDRPRRLGQLRRDDALQALAREGRLPREAFVCHAAERVDVGAMIDPGGVSACRSA